MEKVTQGVRGEIIIIAALIMILAAQIGNAVWPMAATDSECADAIRNYIAQKNTTKNVLIDLVGIYGFFLLTMSLIATGIRRIRSKWTSIKGVALVIVGLGVLCYHVVEIKSYQSIGKTLDDIKSPNLEIIKFKAEQQNLPLSKRSKLSKMYAHDKYVYEGKIVEYISDEGESKNYEPSADDIKFRNGQNNAREIWDYNNRRLPKLLQWWVAIGLVSIFLGIFTPIRKAAPNPRLDHDRA